MFAKMKVALFLGLFLFGSSLAVTPEADEAKKPTPEEIQKAQKQVEELGPVKKTGINANVKPIIDESVVRTFPNHLFFSFLTLHKRDIGPGGASRGNLAVVPRKKEGKLQLFTDVKQLEKFFKSSLGQVKDESRLKDVARTWLELVMALGDRHYQFTMLDESIKVIPTKVDTKVGKKVTATFVDKHDKTNSFTATLFFDEAGKLVEVEQTDNTKPHS